MMTIVPLFLHDSVALVLLLVLDAYLEVKHMADIKIVIWG